MAELVALRLSLPRRLEREPLDALLESLTGARALRVPEAPHFGRALRLTERGIARLPGVANTCLYRALARYALLRQSGVGAEFVMGIGAAGANGHAWIEVAGAPFEERDEDIRRYTVTFRYPPTPKDVRIAR